VAEHNRLAATGWQYEQHRSMPLLIRLADFTNGLLLVWAEGWGHGSPSGSGGSAAFIASRTNNVIGISSFRQCA
jgi:hypothetical protein